MWAVQQGNEIHAVELRLVQQQGAQQATAIGPGRIALLDKSMGKRSQHARWKDKLVSSRDGVYDLLVLTEEAAFIDDEHQQLLGGDTLKVWLEPAKPQAGDAPAADQKPAPAAADRGADSHGRRPHHVVAEGHVVARSPDMNVHDTDRLTIFFRDDPQAAAELAAAQARDGEHPAGAAPGSPGASPPPADRLPDKAGPEPATATPAPMAGQTAAPPTKPAAEPDKQARPMDLRARLVEAHVVRGDSKNELERLWTEGKVHVHQEPANPADKGVDIKGETLQLTRKPEGNYLVVTGGGEGDDLANLLMDKIQIIGPVVHIDQGTNRAWVDGTGAMRMDSDTDFEGRKLKEPVPLTIHWDSSMIFDGQYAEFHGGKGGVQADQQNSRLLCRSMQAFFDRTISLKQNDKNAPPAKVRRLNCDQQVRVDDTELDEKGQFLKYQRIDCPELRVDNEANEVNAPGPGVVRILQRGSEDPVALTPSSPATGGTGSQPKAAADELKLTRVRFAGQMFADNKKHTAIFTNEVRVVHVPVTSERDVDIEPNLDKLPEGGLYLEADRLKVWTRQDAEGKSTQMMESQGHCYFQSQDTSGRAEQINYDESKDQVILVGGENSLAYVYREKVKGGPREELKAKKIMYQRRTGQFYAIDATGVESH
jgi:hypothetical protein